MRKIIIMEAVVLSLFLAGACVGTGYARDGKGEPNGKAADEPRSGPEPGEGASNEQNIRTLMVDLASYHASSYLKRRFMGLSNGGASGDGNGSDGGTGAEDAYVGVLWVRSSSVTKIDPLHVEVDLVGQGWRWVEEEQKKLGATFSIDEYVRFTVNITITGTFKMAYDTESHILTAWLIPTVPARTDFQVIGDVDVGEENLWSSILGTAAGVFGQDPEQEAKQTIQEKGGEQFEERLNAGMTVIIDMCSGRRFVRFGTYPAGKLPEERDKPQKASVLAHGTGRLHPGGLLLAGPFEPGEPLAASMEVTEGGGGVESFLVCENDASRVADAYANGEPLPDYDAIDASVASSAGPRRLQAGADTECPMVLVMKPAQGQKEEITFRYQVNQEGARRPLVHCGD